MKTLDEAVVASRKGAEALDMWLARNTSRITAALSEELRDDAKKWLAGGRPDESAPRFRAAAAIFLMTGRHREAVHSNAHFAGSLYLLANAEKGYVAARDIAEMTRNQASQVGDSATCLRMGILGADCAYWIAEHSPDPRTKARWLQLCLEEMDSATAGFAPTGAELQQYCSVAIVAFLTVDELKIKVAGSPFEHLLRSLARATERIIPSNFEFPKDPRKTSYAAYHLARLSDTHGEPAHAKKRRAFLATRDP